MASADDANILYQTQTNEEINAAFDSNDECSEIDPEDALSLEVNGRSTLSEDGPAGQANQQERTDLEDKTNLTQTAEDRFADQSIEDNDGSDADTKDAVCLEQHGEEQQSFSDSESSEFVNAELGEASVEAFDCPLENGQSTEEPVNNAATRKEIKNQLEESIGPSSQEEKTDANGDIVEEFPDKDETLDITQSSINLDTEQIKGLETSDVSGRSEQNLQSSDSDFTDPSNTDTENELVEIPNADRAVGSSHGDHSDTDYVSSLDSCDERAEGSCCDGDDSSDAHADKSESEESSIHNPPSPLHQSDIDKKLIESAHFGHCKPIKKDDVNWNICVSSVKPDKQIVTTEDTEWTYKKEVLNLKRERDHGPPATVLDLSKARLLRKEGNKLLVEFEDFDPSQLPGELKGDPYLKDTFESFHSTIHPRLLSNLVPEDEDLSRQDVDKLTLKIEDVMRDRPTDVHNMTKRKMPVGFQSHQEQLRILDNLQYCRDKVCHKFENSTGRKKNYRRLLERFDAAIFKAMKGEKDILQLRLLPSLCLAKRMQIDNQCPCCEKLFHSVRVLQIHMDDCVKKTWTDLMKQKVKFKA